MTTQEIKDYVWSWLRNRGLNEKATAGIMGNISQESSWDANLIEVGSGVGFGLCQWSYTRRTQLEAYGTDLDHQLNFLWAELTGEYLSITGAELQWFNSNGFTYNSFINGEYSPSESASAFCWCWERPNASQANEAFRQSEAENFLLIYTGTGGSSTQVENAVQWFINIANDETHGYDQDNRWSPDYDCSSFVIEGFEQAGIPLKTNGATYTGDMKSVAINTGFKEVAWNNDINNLVRGDIILNETYHVCVYIGNGQIVQASINELGSAHGGQTGDQTGKEIYVRDFYTYSHGWDCVLRYGNSTPGGGTIIDSGAFDDSYFSKYETYFNTYDDLSEVYKKMLETPYIFNQLSSEQITFLRSLNFNDNIRMKYTFNRNKMYIGENYLGNKLTFDNKEYKIVDVSTKGYIAIDYSGSGYNNYVNPLYLYQDYEEKLQTKNKNVEKIKAHIIEEDMESQGGL